MNVTYELVFNAGEKPTLCKNISTDDGSQSILTCLTSTNVNELAEFTDDQIWQHMDNLVDYMRQSAQNMTLIPAGSFPRDGLPVVGWSELSQLSEEVYSWWRYALSRDEHVHVEIIPDLPV